MPTHASLAPQFSPSMSPPATFSVLTDSVSLVGMLTARVKGMKGETLRVGRKKRSALVFPTYPIKTMIPDGGALAAYERSNWKDVGRTLRSWNCPR